MARGLMLFTFGLAKKILLADVFGSAVDILYQDVSALTSTTAFLAMLGYTLQIYFDFSGYSDMAIGLGWMLHIDLPVNFDSPYKALSVTEFWKRWHITLTAFFRKYVYFPLGGSRRGERRTYFNILLVFFLSGLWHGAGWTFVLWGVAHGLAQMVERVFAKQWKRLHPALSWLLAFGFINIAWIFFRADSLSDACTVVGKLFSFEGGEMPLLVLDAFFQPEWRPLKFLMPTVELYQGWVIIAYFLFAIALILGFPNAKTIAERPVVKRRSAYFAAFLLVWCLFSFSGISTFLYWNF